MRDSYAKLLKRYSAKTDDNTLVKLKKLQDAYAILSDSAKRREYNSSIGITDERIAQERAEISDNEKMKIEYREQLESKEFWAKFDELSFNAQTGDAESQNRIGEMYYYGDEVEQDLDQAVYWFKEAAKQKHADAMYNLGVCFVNGEGVEKNKTTGLGFIRQAAKLGYIIYGVELTVAEAAVFLYTEHRGVSLRFCNVRRRRVVMLTVTRVWGIIVSGGVCPRRK